MIGVTIGYYAVSKSPLAIILGAINLSIFIFFVVWSFYFLKKYTNSGSLVTYFDVDKLVEGQKLSLARRFIKLIRPMGRRNFYSLAFLVIAIVGGYPWVLGILTAAMVMFLIHQMEDMIKLRRVDPKSSNLK
jgi:hypothetical protein